MMKRRLAAGFMVIAMAGSLMACGSEKTATSTTAPAAETGSTTETTASGDSVIKVRVAGTADYKPYTYLDEADNVTGYDIEVIKAIDELAPEIECEYTYTEWDTMLPGLDADRFDLVTNQLCYTDERNEMYLYPKCPFLYFGSTIISSADDPINTWEDLSGKTMGAIVGSSFTTQMEEYLEEHPGAFEIKYVDGTIPQVLEQIANGSIDATMNDAYVACDRAEIAGITDKLYFSDVTYNGGFSYFLFAKTDKGQQIADIVDKYLPELYYNGTLAEIAKEYLGTDSGVTSMAENGMFEEATLEEYQAAHE